LLDDGKGYCADVTMITGNSFRDIDLKTKLASAVAGVVGRGIADTNAFSDAGIMSVSIPKNLDEIPNVVGRKRGRVD